MQIPAGYENHTGEQPAKLGVESVTKDSREGAQGKSYRKICSSSTSVGVPPVFPQGGLDSFLTALTASAKALGWK